MPTLTIKHFDLSFRTAYAQAKELALAQREVPMLTPGTVHVEARGSSRFAYRYRYDAAGKLVADYLGPEASYRADPRAGRRPVLHAQACGVLAPACVVPQSMATPPREPFLRLPCEGEHLKQVRTRATSLRAQPSRAQATRARGAAAHPSHRRTHWPLPRGADVCSARPHRSAPFRAG